MNANALAETVMEVFDKFDSFNKLVTIAKHWELVLDLIEEKGQE